MLMNCLPTLKTVRPVAAKDSRLDLRSYFRFVMLLARAFRATRFVRRPSVSRALNMVRRKRLDYEPRGPFNDGRFYRVRGTRAGHRNRVSFGIEVTDVIALGVGNTPELFLCHESVASFQTNGMPHAFRKNSTSFSAPASSLTG